MLNERVNEPLVLVLECRVEAPFGTFLKVTLCESPSPLQDHVTFPPTATWVVLGVKKSSLMVMRLVAAACGAAPVELDATPSTTAAATTAARNAKRVDPDPMTLRS